MGNLERYRYYLTFAFSSVYLSRKGETFLLRGRKHEDIVGTIVILLILVGVKVSFLRYLMFFLFVVWLASFSLLWALFPALGFGFAFLLHRCGYDLEKAV